MEATSSDTGAFGETHGNQVPFPMAPTGDWFVSMGPGHYKDRARVRAREGIWALVQFDKWAFPSEWQLVLRLSSNESIYWKFIGQGCDHQLRTEVSRLHLSQSAYSYSIAMYSHSFFRLMPLLHPVITYLSIHFIHLFVHWLIIWSLILNRLLMVSFSWRLL